VRSLGKVLAGGLDREERTVYDYISCTVIDAMNKRYAHKSISGHMSWLTDEA